MKTISPLPVRSAIEASATRVRTEPQVEIGMYRDRIVLVHRQSHKSVKSLLNGVGRTIASFFRGKRQPLFVTIPVPVPTTVPTDVGNKPVVMGPVQKIEETPKILTVPKMPAAALDLPESRGRTSAPEARLSTPPLSTQSMFTALRERIREPLPVHNLNRFRSNAYRETAGKFNMNGTGFRSIGLGPRNVAAARARQLALGDIPARPLAQAVADWYPALEKPGIMKSWSAHASEYPKEAGELSKFLDKLHGNHSAKSPAFRARIVTLLSQVCASPDLRREIFLSADKASSSCQDRIGATFNEMCGHLLAEDIRQGVFDGNIPALALKMRNAFRLDQLQEIGARKTRVLVEEFKNSLGPDRLAQFADSTFEIEAVLREEFVDEIQIYFALQMKLRDALSLDLGALEIQFKSNLKQADFEQAAQTVRGKENDGFADWFANSHHWDAMLLRCYPEKHADFVKARDTGLDKVLETIEADIDAEIAARGMLALMDDLETRNGIRKGISDKVGEDLKRPLTREILEREKCPAIFDPVW